MAQKSQQAVGQQVAAVSCPAIIKRTAVATTSLRSEITLFSACTTGKSSRGAPGAPAGGRVFSKPLAACSARYTLHAHPCQGQENGSATPQSRTVPDPDPPREIPKIR
jgi:hypothetical protein